MVRGPGCGVGPPSPLLACGARQRVGHPLLPPPRIHTSAQRLGLVGNSPGMGQREKGVCGRGGGEHGCGVYEVEFLEAKVDGGIVQMKRLKASAIG